MSAHSHNHNHEQPPSQLGPPKDPSLPDREVLTPMGISIFRDADLENKGYRYSYAKACQERLVEIVYLKDDGTTGTVIADIDSLFSTEVVVNDSGNPVCRVTFKLLREVTSPLNLYCADVPVASINNGAVGKMLKSLLDYFLNKVYGRQKEAV